MKKIFVLSTLLLLFLLGGVSFITDKLIEDNQKILIHEAKAHFDTIVNTRKWNAQFGGVFVKAGDNIRPNPYLKDNTLQLGDGLTLIKINPAWMTRQISTISNASGNYYYKITSLTPINPDNVPDAFEKRALQYLEKHRDSPYYYEFDETGNGPRYFNFIGALVTTKSCLECHAQQGYKEGDIRGGIRVSIPSTEVIQTNRFITQSQWVFSLLLLFLFTLFLFIAKRHHAAKKLKEDAEKKLLEREKELSKILHNLKGVIYKCKNDNQRTMLFISHEIQNISGFKSEELADNRILSYIDLIIQSDRNEVLQKIKEAATGNSRFEIEYRIRTRNGEEKWLREEGNLIDADIIEGYISDITEKKRVEKEIELTKKRLEQAQQIAHVGSWGMNIKDRTTWWSDEMYKIFHVKPLLFTPTYEAFLGFVHPEDQEQVKRAISDTILRHTQSDLHFRILLKGGEIRYIHAQAEIVKEEGNLDMVGTMFDITERRIAEIKQQEQEQLLIQQSKMAEVGEMVAAIAHQWKQPLNIIALNVQEIKDAYEFGELDEPHINKLHDIMNEQIRYMNETIDDFRGFFKPSKEKELFTIPQAIDEVLSIFSAQLKNNHIDTEIKADTDESYTLYGKKNEFKQVLLILINNAKDAIKSFRDQTLQPSYKGHIIFELDKTDKHLQLTIQDNGGGIADTVLSKLFTPYLTTKGEQGTGIGLKLAKTIMENSFAAQITAKNGDKGAHFILSLPLGADEEAKAQQ